MTAIAPNAAAPASLSATQPARSTQPVPDGLLARFPALGLLLLLLGGLLFGLLAVNVRTNGPLLAWDVPIDQAFHVRAMHGSWPAFDAMRFSGALGREMALVITVLLGLVWLWKRHWRALSMLLIGVTGGGVWFQVLSGFFMRPRPVWPDPLDPLPGPGFPSGHSMTAVLLYGLILLLLIPRLSSRRWRLLAVFDAALIILLVGFSRLYMGAHYPTDVLAGYAFGVAWGALVYTGLELVHWRRSTARRVAPG
jgi:membrane-associated phospholipid phosphatase